jgi:hypothetical protein
VCHPEAGEARRGTSQLQFRYREMRSRPMTSVAFLRAEAIERLRRPSARFASLGMTGSFDRRLITRDESTFELGGGLPGFGHVDAESDSRFSLFGKLIAECAHACRVRANTSGANGFANGAKKAD